MLNWFSETMDPLLQEWAKQVLILETLVPVELEMNK